MQELNPHLRIRSPLSFPIRRMRRSGHRNWTDIPGSKVLRAPTAAKLMFYTQTASAQMDSNHPGWFCRPLWPPDPAHEDGQCSSWTNSCGFSVRRYYRVSLLSFFCRITPTIEKQDTKNSMIKSHGAIGWNCCMCPTARWIGFEPITSAFGKQFWYFCC